MCLHTYVPTLNLLPVDVLVDSLLRLVSSAVLSILSLYECAILSSSLMDRQEKRLEDIDLVCFCIMSIDL